jgi:hypothetical protein
MINVVKADNLGEPAKGPPVRPRADTWSVTMEAHIPTLTDIAILPRWAKVQFLARCAARVIPLIQSQWPILTDSDMLAIGMAGGNAEASAQAGREVSVGADAVPRVLELIERAEQEGNMSGFALAVCATAAGLPQVADAGDATRLVASALEQMIQAYAVSELEEGLVVGSVWDDYVALRDAAQAGGRDDQTPMTDDVLGDLWPHGTPPRWPA